MKNKKVLVIVCGSAAIIKAPKFINLLKEKFEVRVLASTFAKNNFKDYHSLASEDFSTDLESFPKHIELAKWADQIVVLPATTNTIAKFYAGIADDETTATLVAARQKIIFVPAMNTYMYYSLVERQIIANLEKMGHIFIGPVVGHLKEGESGLGRMVEPEVAAQAIENYLLAPISQKVLLVNGASKVYLDPIRYISNDSTGTMGRILANTLRLHGYEVEVLEVGNLSNQELLSQIMTKKFGVYVSTAALADFIVEKQENKIHKGELNTLDLKRNIDVLTEVKKHFPKVKCVAFKLDNDKENAWKKLKKLNLDLIVWNKLGAMNNNEIEGAILCCDGQEKPFKSNKNKLAELIAKEI